LLKCFNIQTNRMLSLRDLTIRTIIKNDMTLKGQPYLQRLVIDFCEIHPEQVPESPESYWKLFASYTSLTERKVECNYKGPINHERIIGSFLDDHGDLTTKFVNDEMNKYVSCQNDVLVPLKWDTVQRKTEFVFSPKYLAHITGKYSELSVVVNANYVKTFTRSQSIMSYPVSINYNFSGNAYANYMYKYNPITLVIERDMSKTICADLHDCYKSRPIFMFDESNLSFIDECVDCQRMSANIITSVLKRIKWFRTTIHAQYMSELHFMLLDCDIAHRVWNMITLYPSIQYRKVDT
jgi:hypothetical protein